MTLAEYPVSVTEEEVRAAVLSFLGDYEQVPPMYSALKVDGKKLYELARAGKEVERKARPVKILDICVEETALPRVTMTVSCTKGTYIRTLCYDIGRKLGCGGCMESLLRTRVGQFELKDSLTLSEIERQRDSGGLADHILSVDAVFQDYPALTMKEEFDRLVHNGNAFRRSQAEGDFPVQGSPVRVYDSQGRFIGIYAMDREKHVLKPQKVFLGGNK